jgi:hypothetical protein
MKPISLALVLFAACALLAQPNPISRSARVSFEQRWPDSDPEWFELVVQADGNAKYHSLPHQTSKSAPDDPASEPYELSFTLSSQSRRRIFELAPGLLRFKGALDKTKVAFTGTKTLRYEGGDGISSLISYNYSSSPELNGFTDLMQGISGSIELSRTLQLQLRFDRLALDSTLRSTEASVAIHPLPEPQLLEPILERIANDPGTMNIARQRARHILQAASDAKAGVKQRQ